MYTLFIVIHVIVSLILIVVVLLQSSKGGGLAGAFGGAGGAPQQILGTRGMTTLLHKITIYAGAGFFITSFALFTLAGAGGRETTRSVVQDAARRGDLPAATTTAPAPATDVFSLPEGGSASSGETNAVPSQSGEPGSAGEPATGAAGGEENPSSGAQQQSGQSSQSGGGEDGGS
jgi:preprotein translocase subunit SecG